MTWRRFLVFLPLRNAFAVAFGLGAAALLGISFMFFFMNLVETLKLMIFYSCCAVRGDGISPQHRAR